MVEVGNRVGDPDNPGLHGRRVLHIKRAPDIDLSFRMLEDTETDLLGQVQALPVFLEKIHHSQALGGVVETGFPVGSGDSVKNPLSHVAERRVPQIMPERYRFGQVLVQPKAPGNCSCDLGDFQSVGEARPVVVSFWKKQNLCFMFKATKSLRVDDPVTVDLETGPQGAVAFLPLPPLAVKACAGAAREYGPLDLFPTFSCLPYGNPSLKRARGP